MRQRIIAFLAALFCLATGHAGNIQVGDVSLKSGETKDLKISLTSDVSNMVGLQFDVVLPDGFSLETVDGNFFKLSSEYANDVTCNVSESGSNTYRFVLYSNTLQKLKPGELMSLNLKAGSSMAFGSYTVSIGNVAFADDNGRVTKENGVDAEVRVTDFYAGTQNLQIEAVTLKAGETVSIPVTLLESVNGCVGIQFDMSLPDGFSLEKDGNGKEYELSANQASDVVCNLVAVGNGVYRFMLYSQSLKEFKGGQLMNIRLKVDSDQPLGEYSLTIKEVLLSDAGGTVYKDNGASGSVKVFKLFTLTYLVDGVEYKTYVLENSATITPEESPAKEGYTFSGWSEIPTTMPAKDVTVTGTFTVNTYRLSYVVDGAEYRTYEVDYGASVTPEAAPAKEGYTFSGWSEIPATMPAKDVTVTGTFTLTGINDAIGQNRYIVRILSVGGKPRKELQKGVNIVVMSDGTTSKVVIK